MDTIPVSGANLSATCLGEGSTVIMLHGLVFGNMATWYFPMAMPLASSRRVVVYDQRGHGDSSMVESGFDLDTQADDLAAVWAHYDGGKVDLVGHSVGALVALQFAMRHPERVNRLVLVDAPVPAAKHVAPSLNAVGSLEDIERFADEHMAHGLTQGGVLSARRRDRLYRRLTRLLFETTLVRDVNGMGEPAAEALACVNMPALLVYGLQSPCRAAGEWLQERLPQATLINLDCGHYVPEEAPEALLACIERFLTPGRKEDGQE